MNLHLRHPLFALLSLATVAATTSSAVAQEIRRLEFLGEAVLPAGTRFEETLVGGLSALAYDASSDTYYSLADDPSQRGPARFYTLRLDLTDGKLGEGDVTIEGVTLLRQPDGSHFGLHTVDPEGLALSPQGSLFFSSEGHIDSDVAPLIGEIGHDGRVRRFLPVDDKFLPSPQRRRGLRGFLQGLRRRAAARGPRHNMAFESLSLSPGGEWLFTATENALLQDGPAATVDERSPARIVRYRAETGEVEAEYYYWTEAVAEPAAQPDGLMVAGLVELLALSDDRLLALERSYSAGVGNTIRIFSVDLSGATDVSRTRAGRAAEAQRPAAKTLLLDLSELGIGLDNLEGLSLGPTLPDGRRSLLLVSDDNFSGRQKTQFLAFAWSDRPATIAEIQGRAHRSPLEGNWAYGVPGIVTGIRKARDEADPGGLFWMQDPAAPDAEVSTGLIVSTHDVADLSPGDRVLVSGRVDEQERPGSLSVTSLAGGRVTTISHGQPLPPPTILGGVGRAIPATHLDDDGLTRYEPASDAVDFFESVEGMLVEVRDALVVGPGDRFGGCTILASGGDAAEPRTTAGGVLLGPFDANPERIQIARGIAGDIGHRCEAAVGDRFDGPLRGLVHYEFGAYRLLPTQPLPALRRSPVGAPTSGLTGDSEHLTLATFNVENLNPGVRPEKLVGLANAIVQALNSPDALALQEIQDESGPEDDGVVAGAGTFQALIEAIAAAGGPRYEFRQIDPIDNADGGRPGGNIRVGFLINPARLQIADRGAATATEAVRVLTDERGPFLSPNPARVTPNDPAFSLDETRGYQPARKPLALEIEFQGRRVFLINAHLKSKRGDDGLFGPRQPPVFATEEQRSLQAARIRELITEIHKKDPEAATIVLGDLNEHEFRAPLEVLAGNLLTNLISRVPQPDRYTYIYQGNSQVLDHILVSNRLAENAQVEILHRHADQPVPRPSDHDPVLVRLSLGTR